ncbi:hypothetical protein L6R46_22645 [Myxococcota bacterium]|nr:hypothetical protein [Myxococcota bacterium]
MNAKTSPLNHWHQRIAPQLLPRSEEQSSVELALDEWVYGRECRDHYEAVEVCQLCLQQGLRWHFQIGNGATSQTLWIGSECIKRFDLGVWDQATSQVVHGAAASRLLAADLRRLEEAARIKRLTDLIAQAAALEPDDDDQRYWRQIGEQLVEKRPLTPCRLDYLLLALDYLHLPRPEAKDLKVEAKREHHQRDLVDLPQPAWERVEPYLSAAQRETAEWRRNPRPAAAAPPPPPPPATLDEDDFEEELRDYWRQPGASHAGVLDFFDQWDRRQATKSR